MAAWRLQGDMVIFARLRLRLHRIGRSHWRAAGVLRSWGAVPLYRDETVLHAPCADDEALWLGAWLDDDETIMASVTLSDPASGRSAAITPPGSFQIAGICGSDGGRYPLVRGDAALTMKLSCGLASAPAALLLHTPGAWAVLAGRPAPPALTGTPPLPPRLG
jgi:hypothetical protein